MKPFYGLINLFDYYSDLLANKVFFLEDNAWIRLASNDERLARLMNTTNTSRFDSIEEDGSDLIVKMADGDSYKIKELSIIDLVEMYCDRAVKL